MSVFSDYAKLMLVAFSIIVLAILSGCGGGGGGEDSGGSTTSYYADWTCSGQSQCATVMGGYSGTAGPFSSSAACEQWRQTNILTSSCSTNPGGGVIVPTLTSINVWPSNKGLPIGLTQQYTATGNYSDGTSKDITALVTWYAPPAGIGEPRPPVVASISASGLATASTQGSITITATLGSISGNTKLYVSAATLQSITISPVNPTINQNEIQKFTATGHYSDGSTQTLTSVSWNSGTTAVATIDTTGLATGIAGGTSTITATFGALSGSTTLNVVAVPLQTITVTPADPNIAKGSTGQFVATGTYSDGSVSDISGQVTWDSVTPTVADIDPNGLATGLTPGTSTITATFGDISGSTTLTVTEAALQSLSITPINPSVAQGLTKQFTATGTYSDGTTQDITSQVTWSSGTTAVATIVSSGLATGITAGTSSITATHGIISGTTTLTVVTPGANWIQAASGTTNPLMGVVWSGTQFIAVGWYGTIVTSPDGSFWTPRASGTTNALNAVIKAGNQLVAVGAFGTILTSPDGVTWTPRTSGATHPLYAITWTGTQIVAVGNASHSLTSPDGITWTPIAPPYAFYSEALSIAWNGSYYYVGTNYVSNYVNYPSAFASSNLENWTGSAALDGVFNYGFLWTGTQFIVVQGGGGIKTSDDGSTWTNRPSGSSAALRAVAWSGSHYVVVGNTGTVLTSPDSTAWTPRTSGTTQNLRGVAWSGANFVAVGDLGAILVTSP
jgi:hypothetical protein